MKTIPIALAAHYAGHETSICQCLVMSLQDGSVLRATSLDRPLVIDGNTYAPWLDISNLASTAGLSVDNLELQIVTDDADLLIDLQVGKYDRAAFYLFEVNYLSLADGENPLKRGTTGEAKLTENGSYSLEFRSLKQDLQQPVGILTNKTCRANFADYPRPAFASLCRLDSAGFLVTGTVTTAIGAQTAEDSTRTEDDDWFGNGSLKFTDGLNAGFERQVRTFAAGVFTFALPFPFPIEVGAAYSAIAGCRKRHERTTENPGGASDCIDKFNNVLNFQGEPHLPGFDALSKVPGVGS